MLFHVMRSRRQPRNPFIGTADQLKAAENAPGKELLSILRREGLDSGLQTGNQDSPALYRGRRGYRIHPAEGLTEGNHHVPGNKPAETFAVENNTGTFRNRS